MHYKATLDQEYQHLSALLSRDGIPEGIRKNLVSARQKLEALYEDMSSRYAVDGEWARDPAMGLIQVERITHPFDQPEELYGLDNVVFNVIRLCFYSAEVNIATGEIRALEMLAEARLPESEWGSAIASPNSSHGTATLTHWNGASVTPYDPDKDPVRSRGANMASAIHSCITNEENGIRQHLEGILESLTEKKRLSKKEAAEVARQLSFNLKNLPSNMGYRSSQLLELANQRSMNLANEINLRSKGEK